MISKGNRTLKEILDLILYENPSTQDEIADKLGVTRRYVTKLIQPLIKDGVVRRGYLIDLKAYEEILGSFDENIDSKEGSGNFLIKKMLRNMSDQVELQLETAFTALCEADKEKAELALEMDYNINHMFEKIRTSVETVVSVDPYSKFSKALIFNEVAYDLERIGDYSVHVSKFVVNDSFGVDGELLDYLSRMYDISRRMLGLSMDSFIDEDLALRGDVMDLEERIHVVQKEAFNLMAVKMAEVSFEDRGRSDYFIYLSRVIKAFERIGDISVEIVNTSDEFHKNIPRPTTPESFRNKLRE